MYILKQTIWKLLSPLSYENQRLPHGLNTLRQQYDFVAQAKRTSPLDALKIENVQRRPNHYSIRKKIACEIIGWERIQSNVPNHQVEADDRKGLEIVEFEIEDGFPQRYLISYSSSSSQSAARDLNRAPYAQSVPLELDSIEEVQNWLLVAFVPYDQHPIKIRM